MQNKNKCKKCHIELDDTTKVPIRINKSTGLFYHRRICLPCRRLENVVYVKKAQKTFGKYAFFYRKLKNIRESAKKRNLEFNLNIQDIKDMYNSNICFYCKKIPITVSFDRIDNSKGYIKSNIVFCCFNCNVVKSNRSEPKPILEQIEKLKSRITRLEAIANKLK